MKRIIGYVNTADLNHMREEDVRALTVINIAFGLIRDGEVVWDAKDARDGIVSIRKSNPELKIVLSVGGWGADGFSQAARTKEGRERFANASELVDGTINYDEVGLDGIVVNKYRTDRSDTNYGDLKIGDTLLFHFDVAGQTIEKTFTVAGIAYFPSTGLFYCTSEAIEELSPYNNTSHLSVFCDPDYKESVQDGIMALISGNPNLRLKIYDEEFSTIRGFIKATTSSLYGISAFVILFGLLNMVNMLISSAIVRKREFALLQAVGMTNQQLRKMLYREGMSISVKSAILATFFGVTVGVLLCYLANKVLALKFILFEFNIFPILLFSILLVGLQICISYGVSRSIEKDTLVERLRTE